MSPFAEKVRLFILHYKRILKRYLRATAYAQKVKALFIRRKDLKSANDLVLLDVANRVLSDIETWLANKQLPASEYSGIQEFQNHIKNFLESYEIKEDTVVNSYQHASRAAVNAIQLLNRPCCPNTAKQLEHNIITTRQFGTDEQIALLTKALRKKADDHHEIYTPFLHVLHDSAHTN